MRLVLEEALREFDISPAQYGILNALVEHDEPLSGRAIANHLCVRAQTVAEMLASLEARELIARAPSASHGRVIETTITDAGRARHKACTVRVRAMERMATRNLDPREVDQCIDILNRIRVELDGKLEK